MSTSEKMMRNFSLLKIVGILYLIFTGCTTLKPEKINYNKKSGLYEYPIMGKGIRPLRNENGELINNKNYDSFLIEMAQSGFKYPFELRSENVELLKEEDRKLAALYAESINEIQNGELKIAISKLDTMRNIYPEAVLYSDVAFLQGFASENESDSLNSECYYNEFLRFSSKKYSERFRGYSLSDNNNDFWRRQREHALEFLEGKKPKDTLNFIQSITPKYYFQSLQPGYTLNGEDLSSHPNGEFFITLGTNFSSDYSLGLQYYLNLNNNFDINPGFFISEHIQAVSLALPLQLYRSPDNSLGLKLSPFVRYNMYGSIDLDGNKLDFKEKFFNAGFKFSAGYYFVQRLSVAGWYMYNYYNQDHPYEARTQNINLWWKNEYDVSLYYNLLKGFSLKSGLQNGGIVAGLYWQGTEISYDISNNSFIWRTDLY